MINTTLLSPIAEFSGCPCEAESEEMLAQFIEFILHSFQCFSWARLGRLESSTRTLLLRFVLLFALFCSLSAPRTHASPGNQRARPGPLVVPAHRADTRYRILLE